MGHHILYILHTSTPVKVTVSKTGTASLSPHLITTSAQAKHNLWISKFITGKATLRQFFVIVTGLTGQCDLSEMINPDPAWLPPQNNGASIWSIG